MVYLAVFLVCLQFYYLLVLGKEHFLIGAALLSQTINWLLLGGHHDQTVSARAWVNREDKVWGNIKTNLDKFFLLVFKQEDHCRKSHEEDLRFAKEVLSKNVK